MNLQRHIARSLSFVVVVVVQLLWVPNKIGYSAAFNNNRQTVSAPGSAAAAVKAAAGIGNPTVRYPSVVLSSSSSSDDDDDAGRTSAAAATAGIREGLVAAGSSLQSQLASAFSALDESDQYDAVLTGLCAKILDQPSMTGEDVIIALQDPIQLLEEMNSRKVKAGSRSLMALVDAAAAAQDSKTMAKVILLATRNGAFSQYGILQRDISPLPTAQTTGVRLFDGSMKTRRDRLASLPDVPKDDRGTEVASAAIVATILGFCWAVDILDLDGITPFTSTLWILIVTIGILDNFYELLKFSASTFAKDKVGELPDELPMSLGSGQVSGTVVKGFSRLIQVDTERECECEAAAFFAAYTLGLPCFSFRPNSLEAAVMVAESTLKDNDLDPLLTNNGIMKILVWLMSPVAMEISRHPQLVQSDPREAEGFLTRLEKSKLIDKSELWWLSDDDPNAQRAEKDDLLKWAFAEADVLIQRQRVPVEEIKERLASGAATVGDCVACIENYY